MENGCIQPLLDKDGKQECADQECDDDDDESHKGNRKPVNSIMSAYKLLTPSVKVEYIITSLTSMQFSYISFLGVLIPW